MIATPRIAFAPVTAAEYGLPRGEGHATIIIDPDPQNRRAAGTYAKAGFRPVPHLQGRTPGLLIMQHQEISP